MSLDRRKFLAGMFGAPLAAKAVISGAVADPVDIGDPVDTLPIDWERARTDTVYFCEVIGLDLNESQKLYLRALGDMGYQTTLRDLADHRA